MPAGRVGGNRGRPSVFQSVLQSIFVGQEDGQYGLAVVARMADCLEVHGLGRAARRKNEEDLEVDLRAIRVDGCGEAEDLE